MINSILIYVWQAGKPIRTLSVKREDVAQEVAAIEDEAIAEKAEWTVTVHEEGE